VIIIGAALASAAAIIYYINPIIVRMNDPAAEATIVAATVTVLGVIFSAMYNEISSFYQETSTSFSKKWDLIYPFIRDHYNPWINSAKVFHRQLERINTAGVVSEANASWILYHLAVFYGYRLRFILQSGGLILLSSTREQEKVDSAYRAVEDSLQWAGDDTALENSYLQHLFLTKNKPDQPYVFSQFQQELEKEARLKGMHKTLYAWMQIRENREKAGTALGRFATTFQESVDRLYSAWS
jgi:hypothetical protein